MLNYYDDVEVSKILFTTTQYSQKKNSFGLKYLSKIKTSVNVPSEITLQMIR